MKRPEKHLVVVGDVVLDRDLCGRVDRICPDAPVPVIDIDDICEGPGGAGLTALLGCRPGVQVTLVAPFADDGPGRRLREALKVNGVDVISLAQVGPTRVKSRLRAQSHSVARIDEGGPATPLGELPARVDEIVRDADIVLVADYGAGTTAHPGLRELLSKRTSGRRPGLLVWDPHPRGADPVPGCTVVTPNLAEARHAAGADDAAPDELARSLRATWRVHAVSVTAGGDGAWLATAAAEPFFAPSSVELAGDSCGAGDRFVSTLALELVCGASPTEATTVAVARATDWVRSGGAESFRSGSNTHGRLSPAAFCAVSDVRSHGGTVVATGGCFDVLHPGHLASLKAARALGDALIVLVNSDDSVRRLKGPGRPVQTVHDRAEVLRALADVDEVVVFDEDDPCTALATIRPDVWAKGGDYDASSMPEAQLMRTWGGRIVLLPYLRGRSTTGLLRSHQRREVAGDVRSATDNGATSTWS